MNKINVVIPMAGLGKRFSDCGYKLPKPFLPIGDKTMIEQVILNLNQFGHHTFYFTFVINMNQLDVGEFENKLKNLNLKNYQIVFIDFVPKGPAASALIGVEKTDISLPLIITNCDQIIEDYNFELFNKFCDVNQAEGVLGTFHSSSPKNSYVRLSDTNEVIDVKEKEVISNVATNGFHWWKKGVFFVTSVNQMKQNNDTVNGEFYVACKRREVADPLS